MYIYYKKIILKDSVEDVLRKEEDPALNIDGIDESDYNKVYYNINETNKMFYYI